MQKGVDDAPAGFPRQGADLDDSPEFIPPLQSTSIAQTGQKSEGDCPPPGAGPWRVPEVRIAQLGQFQKGDSPRRFSGISAGHAPASLWTPIPAIRRETVRLP